MITPLRAGITCTVNCNNFPTAGCLPVDDCLANKCYTPCGYPAPDASP